jgi:FAD/FMN-containing dehydrogenase
MLRRAAARVKGPTSRSGGAVRVRAKIGRVDPHVLRELAAIVTPAHLVTDPDTKRSYEIDWTRRFEGSTDAVVRPGSVSEVADVIGVCRREGIAIVPQGGNTGMVGGGVPLAGELVVSLTRLAGVEPVDLDAQQVTAAAGSTVESVQQAAAAVGLRYAVDFGARGTATVGGSIATNAGGLNLIRFGGTREQLVGIEAVLGTGDVVRRMTGLIKDNTGYHLPSLLCGSEGTLGIVTAARFRLVGLAPHRVLAFVAMTSVDAAVAAVARWRTGIPSLEAAELVFHDGIALVSSALGVPLPFSDPSPVYVLLDAGAAYDPTDELAEAVAGVEGVVDAAVASDAVRRAALWRLREDHALAINTIGVPHKFDVTLPQSRLGEFVERVEAVVAAVAPDARVWLFGHVGDGNLHVNVTGVPPHSPRLDEAVYGLVVAMDGSISAEHGIGTAKARYLPMQRSAAELSAMRAVKSALDPGSVMNPNVLLTG